MSRLLDWTTTKGPTVLALGCLLGLIIPSAAFLLRPAMPVMVFIFILGTLLRIESRELFKTAKDIKISVIFPLIFLIACPYVLGALIHFSTGNAELAIAIALVAAAPPSSGNAAVARMLKLDPSTALVSTLSSMALVPVTAPFVFYLLETGNGFAIGPFDLAVHLAVLIGGAGATAVLMKKRKARVISDHAVAIDGAVIAALFVFAVGAMAGIQELVIADPSHVLLIMALCYLANVAMQLFFYVVFPGSKVQKLTIGLTAANRNVGLLWATLGASISPTMLLVFACAQLPIYTMPRILQYILTKNAREN